MKASCQCGALRAEISGTGQGVMCHCKACQRRTGSPFGMMIYYAAGEVTISGDSTPFTRIADSGDELTHGFCPTCGTAFWLTTAKYPGGIGIAVGAHEGHVSAPPARSVFEECKHPWVDTSAAETHFSRGRTG